MEKTCGDENGIAELLNSNSAVDIADTSEHYERSDEPQSLPNSVCLHGNCIGYPT